MRLEFAYPDNMLGWLILAAGLITVLFWWLVALVVTGAFLVFI